MRKCYLGRINLGVFCIDSSSTESVIKVTKHDKVKKFLMCSDENTRKLKICVSPTYIINKSENYIKTE